MDFTYFAKENSEGNALLRVVFIKILAADYFLQQCKKDGRETTCNKVRLPLWSAGTRRDLTDEEEVKEVKSAKSNEIGK